MTGQKVNRERIRSVLHVLPHPGGGGETYVDALTAIEEYRLERAFLAPDASERGAQISVMRRALGAQWASREHTILHTHGEVASMLCLPALAARPSVVTLHGLHLLRRLAGTRRAAAEANLRLIVRAATRTICVSGAEHDELVDVVGTSVGRRTLVIHNGVEPAPLPSTSERAAVRSELGIASTTTVGISVGSLDEHKDPLTPVRAAIDLARTGVNIALIMVGDGPLRPHVEQIASEDKHGTVKVIGFRRDVQRILGAADFFVLSSEREGLSFSLLEAMSLGLPAVVSDVPGNPEAVGETGIVVGFRDHAGFTAAFERFVGREHERLALGTEARERVIRWFRAEEMLRQTRTVYDSVLAAHDFRQRRRTRV